MVVLWARVYLLGDLCESMGLSGCWRVGLSCFISFIEVRVVLSVIGLTDSSDRYGFGGGYGFIWS